MGKKSYLGVLKYLVQKILPSNTSCPILNKQTTIKNIPYVNDLTMLNLLKFIGLKYKLSKKRIQSTLLIWIKN